ncbi:MAG: acyl carrier protein [Verrucomicrobiales bacterium]|jgi:acyl carrier protein
MSADSLQAEIKEMMIDELMLEESADEIDSETPIFGPEGLGLDSVDALQLVVGIEKRFDLKLSDSETARGVLRSVTTIAEAIEQHRAAAQ